MAAQLETSYPEKLDDLLSLPVAQMVEALPTWVNEFDDKHFGTVLIKTNDSRPLKVGYRGKEFNIPPRGRRIDRKTAVELLKKFGKNGVYYGKDRATGLTEARWFSMNPTEKERYDASNLNFQTQYLTHIPDSQTDDEEEISSEEK